MRDLTKHSHRLADGWFWATVLLILPACSFSSPVGGPGPNLPKGAAPHNAAIFCDIEKALGRHCATSLDKAMGIRLSEAAIALAEGRTSNVALDDSPDALTRCGGEPEAVIFEGPFPRGMHVCLNCDSIATNFAGDNEAACRAACYDLFGPVDPVTGFKTPENPPDPLVVAFCAARARPSTNFSTTSVSSPPTGCYVEDFAKTCVNGTLDVDHFADPRRFSEPVVWENVTSGVVAGGAEGNDLVRQAPTTPPAGAFDKGATSQQWIVRGDAWVEFSVTRGTTQALGFAEVPVPCVSPCPDINADIPQPVALLVRFDGLLDVYEDGIQKMGPGPGGSFSDSFDGQRLRVRLRDNGNGTATVRYTKVIGFCAPGTVCTEQDIDPSSTRTINYPVRVDTTLFHELATFTNVRLVRIK